MHNTIGSGAREKLEADIQNSEGIYDILAAAYNALGSYSPGIRAYYKPGNYETLIVCITTFDISCNDNSEESFLIFQKNILSWLYEQADILFLDIYALICNIDRIHSYKPQKTTGRFSMNRKITSFQALNNLYFDDIRILPRLENTLSIKMNDTFKENGNRLRERNVGTSNDINSELQHYDILKTDEQFLPKIHCFTEKDANKVSKRLIDREIFHRGCLTIGLFPLWGKDIRQTLDIKFTETTFYVAGMKPDSEESIQMRFIDALNRCKEMGVDIAVFPEMIMTRKILGRVIDYVKRLPEDDLPILMVMGTIWETEPYKRNVCVVLSCGGDVLIEQQKQTPFNYRKPGHTYPRDQAKKSHTEDILLNDKTIHVIDIEGVGRFFTHICLDALNSNLMQLPEKLNADMVLVPAFSLSMDMRNRLDSLTKGCWSTVLLCNACSALCRDGNSWISFDEGLELGFILTPAKEETGRALEFTPLNMSDSCKSCQNDACHGGIFDIYYNNYLPPDQINPRGRIEVRRRE